MKAELMEDHYKWFTEVSLEAQEKVKQKISEYIQSGMGRCKCGPLNISIATDPFDSFFKARIRCKCGLTDEWGVIEGGLQSP